MSVNIFVVGIWERISRKKKIHQQNYQNNSHTGEERYPRNLKRKEKQQQQNSHSRINNLSLKQF